jgi:hypothetical protein
MSDIELNESPIVKLEDRSTNVFSYIDHVCIREMPITISVTSKGVNISFSINKNSEKYTKEVVLDKLERMGARDNRASTLKSMVHICVRFKLEVMLNICDEYTFKPFTLTIDFPDGNTNSDFHSYLSISVRQNSQKYNPKRFRYEEK